MAFDRTDSGKKAKYLFYTEILVWVEGPRDVAFLDHLVQGLPYRFERANGKEECRKLADEILVNDCPYVVVIDGDYETLTRSRSPHRRVVILQRYSIENYLFEKDIIEDVCQAYLSMCGVNETGREEGEEVVSEEFDNVNDAIQRDLREAIVLDIASCIDDEGVKVLPDRVEPLLKGNTLSFDRARVKTLCTDCETRISNAAIDETSEILNSYLEKGRIADIFRGHLIFGIIRRMIFTVVKERVGQKPTIDDKALMLLMSATTWSGVRRRSHHVSLRRRLRHAVRDANSLR